MIDTLSLLNAAIELASQRLPEGEAVAAAIACESGAIHTGIWCNGSVDAACLCAETGPICNAHTTGDGVVASVCVSRVDTHSAFRVLPACGICQERLAFWGLEVVIGVPGSDIGGICDFVSLRDLRPHYWRTNG